MVATPTEPTLISAIACPSGIAAEPRISSFVLLPHGDHLLTLEGDRWVTRSIRTGQPHPEIEPSPWSETALMWTERVSSPDGQWLVALNGQAAMEIRHRDRLAQRQMIDWQTELPKGYGFWTADNNLFFVSMDNGIMEAWDLVAMRRVARTPAAVGETEPPPDPTTPAAEAPPCSLRLTTSRALWRRADTPPDGEGTSDAELRPLGRHPLVGGATSGEGRTALLVTGAPDRQPHPDDWIGGEIIRYDPVGSKPVAAVAHGIRSNGPIHVHVSPSLAHVFLLTADGALHCVESATGRTVYSIGHSPLCTAAAFSHDGQRCLIGRNDGEVLLYDYTAGRLTWRRKAHEFTVLRAGLSPDGRRAVTFGADRSMIAWDTVAGEPLAAAPPRYRRERDPLELLADANATRALAERLGPAPDSVLPGSEGFALDYGGGLYRFRYDDLAHPERLWQGPAALAGDKAAYIVYEPLPPEKRKEPKTGVFRLDPHTGDRSLLAAVEVPPEAGILPLFVNPKRCLLPRTEGGLLLLRLDKKLFQRDIVLDTGTLCVTTMDLHVSADGSVFALSHGAELRLFRSADGTLLRRFVLEAPRREGEPDVVACRLAGEGGEVTLVLQSGTLQRWKP